MCLKNGKSTGVKAKCYHQMLMLMFQRWQEPSKLPQEAGAREVGEAAEVAEVVEVVALDQEREVANPYHLRDLVDALVTLLSPKLQVKLTEPKKLPAT